MQFASLRLSALALALAGATAAQAQSFSGAVTIGDSLSDSGNVAALLLNIVPPGNAFTTNPDPVYAEIVAAAFGYSQTNYSPLIAGSVGSDYAVGGACVRTNSAGFVCANDVSGSAGLFSLTYQLEGYLSSRSGQADPHALYMLWGGGNDVGTAALHPATADQNVILSADALVDLIGTLQSAGAGTIVVLNQYDGGLTPANLGTGNQALISHLDELFNTRFNAGLASLGDGIVPINVNALFNEFIADPARYGFSNVTDRACGPESLSLGCGPAGSDNFYTYAPGANDTYLFADADHPSGAAHARLARVVLATLAAPGQVSMASELPLQTYDDHSQVINARLFAGNDPGNEKSGVYARVQSGRQRYAASANVGAMDDDRFTGTFGADWSRDTITWGTAISVDDGNADMPGAVIDGSEVLVSVYGAAWFDAGYIDAIASGGHDALDIDRRIALGGPTARNEHGSTHASHWAMEVGGGFVWGVARFRHGPFANLAWQSIEVAGYAEQSLDSTAMNFDRYARRSLVGRIGYRAEGRRGRWQPFARVAYARECDDDATVVRAGSNTMNGHFRLPGFKPARDWFEADLGASWVLNERTALSISYRTQLGNGAQDLDSLAFGLRTVF